MLLKLPGTRLSGTAAAVPLLLTLSFAALPHPAFAAPVPASTDGTARVQTMYTSWDDYYFYAAFRVRDTNVLGTTGSHHADAAPGCDASR